MNPVDRVKTRLPVLLGQGLPLSMGVILVVAIVAGILAFLFLNSAPPTTVTMTSGPEGSAFRTVAEQYRKILAREGVTVTILTSQGSRDNLARLADPKVHVDVGFVVGGETAGKEISHLVSLGSVSYQPMMIFYRGPPKLLLSAFKGQRLDVGQEGSGASVLAQRLFEANGIKPADDGTQVGHASPAESVKALLEGRIDALFAMSDSTPTEVMRQLLRNPDIHLFNFVQAEGYAHRITYLNRLVLPRGAIDFGADIPAEDVSLIAPTVELVARDSLHPALSDLLLEAARQVHGRAGLYKKAGEFPAPIEHDFAIGADAARFYASGRSFFYRTFPFWIASLIERILAIVLPVTIILIPGFRIAPAVFRWRAEWRIKRWYAVLQRIERAAERTPPDDPRRAELLRELEGVEATVTKLVVPPAYGDVLYDMRSHIAVVREGLLGRRAVAEVV